jgi:hypothetical protein
VRKNKNLHFENPSVSQLVNTCHSAETELTLESAQNLSLVTATEKRLTVTIGSHPAHNPITLCHRHLLVYSEHSIWHIGQAIVQMF